MGHPLRHRPPSRSLLSETAGISPVFVEVGRLPGSVRGKSVEPYRERAWPRRMKKRSPFRYFKTSPEIVRLAAMTYVRFLLSLRNMEDLRHDLGIGDRQETGRWRNDRAENSHQPFRRRERAMLRFRRIQLLQEFAAVHASVHNHFNQERALYGRQNFTLSRAAALAELRQLCAA